MTTPPKVSVVLGSYNRKRFLRAAVQSVRRNGYPGPIEIIVVDGGSTDGSLRWLTAQRDVMTIVQHNRGDFRGVPVARRSWGYFMNRAFKCAEGRYVLMVSDDCLLVPGAIASGVRQFQEALDAGRRVGAVAFYWRNWPEDEHYRVGLTLGGRLFVNHGLYLREALEEVGWIDEDRYAFYHADGDLALKLWTAGFTVEECPDALVEHFTHANAEVRESNLVRQQQDWAAYVSRWSDSFDLAAAEPAWRTIARRDQHGTARGFPAADRARLRIAATRPISALRGARNRLRQRLRPAATQRGG